MGGRFIEKVDCLRFFKLGFFLGVSVDQTLLSVEERAVLL